MRTSATVQPIETSAARSRRSFVANLGLVAVVLSIALPYCTALHHKFVYDDHKTIVENPFLADPANLFSVFAPRNLLDSSLPDSSRPLAVLTFFADRMAWGLRPAGYLLTNLTLHLAASALVMLLAWRVIRNRFAAISAGLVFGYHPVLSEAVRVASFREDPLATVFVLAYLLIATTRLAWLSIPTLILALLSKESAVAGPFLLAWLWMCFPHLRPSRQTARILLAAAGLVLCAFLLLWTSAESLQAAHALHAPRALSFPATLLTAPWLWLKGARLLALPFGLQADYVIRPVVSALDLRFTGGLIALIVAAAAAFGSLGRRPHIAFVLGWLLLAFVPVSNIIPLYNAFAERFLYLPAAGFALSVGLLLRSLPDRRLRSLVLAALCSAGAALTIARLPAWKDDASLWTCTLAQEPRSVRANVGVGLELKRHGDFDSALEHFLAAAALDPSDARPLINAAVLHGERGDAVQAERILREAIRIQPDNADAYWNLAVALMLQEKHEEAFSAAAATLEHNPRHAAARQVLDENDPR